MIEIFGMSIPFPMFGIALVFAAIFVAGKLAKMNSPVIDACAWILGIILFVVIILSKLHF